MLPRRRKGGKRRRMQVVSRFGRASPQRQARTSKGRACPCLALRTRPPSSHPTVQQLFQRRGPGVERVVRLPAHFFGAGPEQRRPRAVDPQSPDLHVRRLQFRRIDADRETATLAAPRQSVQCRATSPIATRPSRAVPLAIGPRNSVCNRARSAASGSSSPRLTNSTSKARASALSHSVSLRTAVVSRASSSTPRWYGNSASLKRVAVRPG